MEISGPALTHLLQVAGLDARWVRPAGRAGLQQGEVVVEMHLEEQLRAVALPAA